MQQRTNIGRPIALLGAILVLVSLFLDWFGVSNAPRGDEGITAWTAFETLDLVLAAIGIAALAIIVPRLLGRPALLAERWLPALGAAALVIVVAALLNHPPAADGLDEKVGAWLAFAGAILFAVGSFLWHARVEISMSFGDADEPRESRPAPAAPPPRGTAPADPPTERL